MFGEEDAMIRVDMSEYGETCCESFSWSASRLCSHDDGGQLTEKS